MTAVMIAVVVYWLAFLYCKLPAANGMQTIRRYHAFTFLLLPDEWFGMWFGPAGKAYLWDRLPVLAVASVVVLTLWGLGLGLLRLICGRISLEPAERLVFSFTLGANILSTYVLAVGLAGQLRSRAAVLGPIAVALCCMLSEVARLRHRGTRGLLANFLDRTRQLLRLSNSLWFAVGFCIFLAVIVLGALLPPIEFDVLEYHLQAPKEFFQNGRVFFVEHNVYANMPLGAEMLVLFAMMVSGDWWLGALAGKLVLGLVAPITALAVYVFTRRVSDSRAGIWAALAYIATPWIIQQANLGLIDHILACYWLLSLYAFTRAFSTLFGQNARPGQRESLRWLALSGWLAGGAAACKYPAVLFLLAPLVLATLTFPIFELILYRGQAFHTRTRFKTVLGRLVLFAFCAILGGGLWYAKNAALAGNPVYPLMYEVFDGKNWTPEKNARWQRAHRPEKFSPDQLAKDAIRVAVASPWLSPITLPFAILGMCFAWRERWCKLLVFHAVWVLGCWWLFTHRIDRFWIPILAEFSVLAGVAAGTNGTSWRRFSTLSLAIAAFWGFLVGTTIGGGCNFYFAGLDTLRRSPLIVDPWHLFLNSSPKPGGVLLVGDARPFYLERPAVYNTCFDDCVFELWTKNKTAAEVHSILAENNVAYVYVHWGEIARYRAPGNYGFTDYVQPSVFSGLVEAGVLRSLPQVPNHPGRMYEVRPLR